MYDNVIIAAAWLVLYPHITILDGLIQIMPGQSRHFQTHPYMILVGSRNALSILVAQPPMVRSTIPSLASQAAVLPFPPCVVARLAPAMPQRALPAARKSPATRQARQLVDVDPKVISSHETPSLHGPKQKYVEIPYIHHGFHVGIDPIHLDN